MIYIDYKDQRSICQQISQRIKELIICGAYEEGRQLPSVRELSISLAVNPNTVQKSYSILESQGYIYSVKGKGCFVSPPPDETNSDKIKDLLSALDAITKELKFRGADKGNIISVIDDIYKEG